MFDPIRRLLSRKPPPISENILAREESISLYIPGHYHPTDIGDKLDRGRYTIVQKLGWGQYSTVWLADDAELKCNVAIKILKSDAEKIGLPEIPLLERVNASDRQHPGYTHVTSMMRHFEHDGPNGKHRCIVFKVLGDSLAHLQSRLPNKTLPVPLLKQICKQTLLALDFLHYSCGIIHTDLKPTNMLICLDDPEKEIQRHLADHAPSCFPLKRSSPNMPLNLIVSQPIRNMDRWANPRASITIQLADLGVGNLVESHWADIVQTPAARAPEVTIGAPWGTSADIWSLGCVIYLMATSECLFNPDPSEDGQHSGEECHLAEMMLCFGNFPLEFIRTGRYSEKYFDMENGTFLLFLHPYVPPPSGQNNLQFISGELRRLVIDPTEITSVSESLKSKTYEGFDEREASRLGNFIEHMIRLRPEDRATAKELLDHFWLQDDAGDPVRK